jgi:hypothetical protein
MYGRPLGSNLMVARQMAPRHLTTVRRSINMAIFIRPAAMLAVALSGIVQTLIDFNLVHFSCVLLATVSSVATMAYVLEVHRFRTHPMSMIVVLGYNVTALSGALLVQTASLVSLTDNLEVPLATFSALTVVQLLVLGLHISYVRSRVLAALRARLTYRFLAPLGFLDPPSNGQLWIMGLIGCAAIWLTEVVFRDQVEFGDVTLRFIQGLSPFAIAPFLIPLARYVFADGARRVQWTGIGAYFLLMVFIAIARNARQTFASGILTIGLIFVACVLSGRIALAPKKLAWSFIIIVGLLPIFSTLSDLATAMVIVRGERSSASPLDLVSMTVETYLDSNAVEDRRRQDSIVSSAYNEVYIGNPILARFVNTKFVDLNMASALALTRSQVDEVQGQFWIRVLTMLPTPVLKVVAPNFDKNDQEYSSAQFYHFLVRGTPLEGEFAAGSSIADGLAIANVLYLPLLAMFVLMNFIFFDSLTKSNQGWPTYSGVALLNLWMVFTQGVMTPSVAGQVGSIVRGFPEMLILYGLMFVTSRRALRLIGWRARRRQRRDVTRRIRTPS